MTRRCALLLARGHDDENCPECARLAEEEASETVLRHIQALSAMVDQLGAEIKDPETSPARRDAIRADLRQWYEMLKEVAR